MTKKAASEHQDASEGLPMRAFFQEQKEEFVASMPASLLDDIVAAGQRELTTSKELEVPLDGLPGESTMESVRRGWFAWTHWMSTFAGAAVACVAALLWFQPVGEGSDASVGQPPLRSKEPMVRRAIVPRPTARPPVFVPKGLLLALISAQKTSSGLVPGRVAPQGTQLAAGDLIKLEYHAHKPGHLMMLSLNRKGEVSLFVPFGKTQSIRVDKGKGFLPASGSLELDDYVGVEMFFLLSGEKPFSVKAASDAIKEAYEAAKKGGKWYHIRSLRGPWSAGIFTIQKRASNGPK